MNREQYAALTPEERAKKSAQEVARQQRRLRDPAYKKAYNAGQRARYHTKGKLRINNPWARILNGASTKAPGRGLEYSLPRDWGRKNWTGVCALTGIPFDVSYGSSDRAARWNSPSIDRIDSAKGYIEGNVRWVLWCINTMKGRADDATIIMVAKALLLRDFSQPEQAHNPVDDLPVKYPNQRRYRIKNPWHDLFRAARYRSKKSGLDFNLTRDWCRESWTGVCSLTGIPFDTGPKVGRGMRWNSPSLDRIDPTKGYTIGNVRWIIWSLNAMKGLADDATIMRVARSLLEH